jgi:peptidoglycan-N-acetylglucosamine deacetylase
MSRFSLFMTAMFFIIIAACNNATPGPLPEPSLALPDSPVKAKDNITGVKDSTQTPANSLTTAANTPPAPVADQSNPNTKKIYLTFDDGPLGGSEVINEIVKTEQVNVNVFVVGRHAQASEQLRGFYRLYQDNPFIEIGNHSYTHANNRYQQFYTDPPGVLADFMKTQNELPVPNKLARLPGRNMWRLSGVSLSDLRSGQESADLLYQNGFRVFGWDLEWNHSGRSAAPVQSAEALGNTITRMLEDKRTLKPNHIVVLVHDEMFHDGQASGELRGLIQKLKAKPGYEFAFLSKYPG